MREVRLVPEESTQTSLVFVDDDGAQYFIVIDDTLRSVLAPSSQNAHDPAESDQHSALSAVTESNDSAAEDTPSSTDAPTSDAPSTGASSAINSDAGQNQPSRTLRTQEPQYSKPLPMSPREIQARVRAGATADELADEMGVAVSRVESYAHPVLMERQRIAEMARTSHPVREDGPAELTLAEVLSAAFGARGHSLADVTWDAFREPGGEWIIRLEWQAGLSDNEAEFILRMNNMSSATAEPRNAVAADLTNPDFIQPVRTLTSIHGGTRYEESVTSNPEDDVPEEAHDTTGDAEESFLQHPGEEEEPEKPTRKRRKAVTPHWEDVLLGVRTNTKRPRE